MPNKIRRTISSPASFLPRPQHVVVDRCCACVILALTKPIFNFSCPACCCRSTLWSVGDHRSCSAEQFGVTIDALSGNVNVLQGCYSTLLTVRAPPPETYFLH